MKYKLFLVFLVVFSFLAAIVHAQESSTGIAPQTDPPILCKSMPLPSDELWKKCESVGMVVVQVVENGCVVGYDCGQVSDPGPAPTPRPGPMPPVRDPSLCADIAPPSEELCTKCHDAGMLVQKNIRNGCVAGYECVENLYMGPLPPADECVVNIPCPPIKPAADLVNDCESKGGVFTIHYSDKCEVKFECNFIGAVDPAPSPGPVPYTNSSTGCPVVDVPEDFKSECAEKPGTVVVRYDANCNAKFYCIERPLIGPPVPAPTPVPIRSCEVDPALIKEFNDVVKQLREKTSNAADEDTTELKQRMAKLNVLIKQQKEKCNANPGAADVAPPQTGVAVGINCRIPPELQKELLDAWNTYRELLKSPNDVDLTAAKRRISDATIKISEYKKKCATTIVPGQIGAACAIPEDLMKRLEGLYKQYSDLEKSMQASQEQLENTKRMIDDLEKQLLVYRARCNRLPIDSDTTTANIAKYYAQRMSDISSDNPDEQLVKLKELRAEIDGTLKDFVEQRKSMKFEELSEMVDEVTVKPESVEIGEAVAETSDVEIQTEVEGSTVSVSTTADSVLITQDGLVVETSEVSVSNSGLSVEGSQVVPPNRLLAVKVLERNKERIQQLTLERREASLVYNAQLQAKKRVLGIIPATAQQTVTMNAETGEIIGQEKPWWTSISTDAK